MPTASFAALNQLDPVETGGFHFTLWSKLPVPHIPLEFNWPELGQEAASKQIVFVALTSREQRVCLSLAKAEKNSTRGHLT